VEVATSLSTLTTSGLATMNAATVTGATSVNSVTASGNASITGTLGVTGNTTLSNFTGGGYEEEAEERETVPHPQLGGNH
jgi:hypothetical protein